jgi:hypothetical protein
MNARAADVFAPARPGPVELRNQVIKAASASDLRRITRAHEEPPPMLAPEPGPPDPRRRLS